MGSVLEAAKLVTVSWVYNHWKTTFSALKLYFLIAVVLLMGITSMGIFGYLSKAHIEHSSTIAPQVAKVEIYDKKIEALQATIERNDKNLKQYDESVDQVMGRSKDERGAERASQIRKAQQKDRERIASENARIQKEIQKLTEEKLPLSLEVKKAESDLGPIKYVAEVVYGTQDRDLIDKAVRLVIFIIIIVFDPLAVLLLVASNQTYRKYAADKVDILPEIKARKRKKIDKQPANSLDSFFVDTEHEVIHKSKIANFEDDSKP
jgi:F0F1-type ATP synthase membrane subunit b/b'